MNFGPDYRAPPVTISPSGPSRVTAGETFSLTCSATLLDPIPLPDDVPRPTYQWFLGPNGNAPLPSGVTELATVNRTIGNHLIFSGTLRFSPLSLCHTGMYTCRIGGGRLASSANVTVNGMIVNTISLLFIHYNLSFFSSTYCDSHY